MRGRNATEESIGGNWWIMHDLASWKYPEVPTKKEFIYRVFRAAYPNGAFVDDQLSLVQLRDKHEIWQNVESELYWAQSDLQSFLKATFISHRFATFNKQMQTLTHKYFHMLLEEAREALFISQNGRYYEFRCMEELLVRYRRANQDTWTHDPSDPNFELPPIEGYRFAKEHLESSPELRRRREAIIACTSNLRGAAVVATRG